MMVNLFSIFDPSTKFMLSSNWLSVIFFFFFLPIQLWMAPPRIKQIFFFLFKYLFKEFKPLVKKTPFILILSLSIFIFIAINNIMGLLPYVFTPSSHMAFTLPLALSLWLSTFIYAWMNNTNNSLTHLIPQGTPFILMPFMVIIETISSLIRPGTLAIRLAANMIAGHLLMVLLSSSFLISPMSALPLLYLSQGLLSILELAVAFIQAYVFSILLTLYAAESIN
uniref:ATP synthase subunit a n=1 Tax=Pseudoniphargus stocki TaxID=2211535 RepID=A0A345K5T0_9CRUS|nr:ATP synthase F0 subunit 6 [Pseudoniphargus stocki]AXH38222.1 ATP synthase F0 subunit 6 [Pseudoniphargus stocki]